MKKIIRVIVPVVVLFANIIVAAYVSVLVVNYLIDELYLVGWWVFPDAFIAIAVAALVFVTLEHIAYALHIELDY